MTSTRVRTGLCLPFISILLLLSCVPPVQPSTQTTLYIYRFQPPAFLEISPDFQISAEIPFSVPLHCGLFDIFSPTSGKVLLIELSCPNGQTVVFLDTTTGAVSQPITEWDSHFLAWAEDGTSAYLKVDSLGDARLVRAQTGGKLDGLSVTGWTYDLSGRPGTDDFIYAFSRGLGYGSELHFTRNNGRSSDLLYEDRYHYISFARYSPDGVRIAFIKIPDSQTPFTVGELWVMEAGGSNPRKLSEADAGHGYAANWSPDGEWIAFVKRENPSEESADRSPEALVSNIYRVNLRSGVITQVTSFTDGRAETPHWSPDGSTLAFNTVLNGRMDVQTADITTGEIRSLITESTCCPAWMRK